jgi:mono/diheme cytochrome c family protein
VPPGLRRWQIRVGAGLMKGLASVLDPVQPRAMWPVERYHAHHAARIALLACTLACGGQAETQRAAPSSAVPRGTPSAPPPFVGSSPPRRGPTAMPVPAEMPPAPMRGPQRDDSFYPPEAPAENVLMSNCGPCHGADAPVATSGGILFIGDVDQLVEAGLIVPLNSLGSRIIRVMLDGSMPPPGAGYFPVTEADINTVASYIDDPRLWPSYMTPGLADAGTEVPAVDAGADGG